MGAGGQRDPLTERQMRIIFEVRMCDPHGLIPKPGALPDLEELVTRGTLVRKMDIEGRANYFMSPAYRAATAQAMALAPQIDPGSVN
jgi:hypothetical protein